METNHDRIGFGTRLWLAFVLPWKLLFDGAFAERTHRLLTAEPESETAAQPTPAALPTPVPQPEPSRAPEPAAETPSFTSALQLLAILQREGRFVDFLQEDVTGFADADVGAAARVVHEGCLRAFGEYLALKPVRAEAEGEAVVLEPGFDPSRTRITGNVVGDPPFHGKLAHHGWQVAEIRLPTLAPGHDPNIVAPAEVEL